MRFIYLIVFLLFNINLQAQNKSVIFVSSYSTDYYFTYLIEKEFRKQIKNKNIIVQYEYINGKKRKKEKDLLIQARRIKKIIDNSSVDLVILADDFANKYIYQKFYQKSKIPFLFIGLNWNASKYGHPSSNSSGQIEIKQIKDLINTLLKYSKGKKIGYLSNKTFSGKLNTDYYKKTLNIKFEKINHVDTFEEWKKVYKQYQNEVDIIIVENSSSIKNWNNKEAKKFVLKHSTIVSGSVSITMKYLSTFTYLNNYKEFGEYAAVNAIKILNGEDIKTIGLSYNKESSININMPLAKKENIIIDVNLLSISNLISKEELKNWPKLYFNFN